MCAILRLHIHIIASQNLGRGDIAVRWPSARSESNDGSVLVDELEVVPAEEVGDGR